MRNQIFYEFVGKLTRYHRRQAGMTLKQVSAESNLSVDYLSRLERGQIAQNHFAMSLIAKSLSIPVTRIFPTILDWGK
jgi:transcriptional regulator with XRE-family HTH domain